MLDSARELSSEQAAKHKCSESAALAVRSITSRRSRRHHRPKYQHSTAQSTKTLYRRKLTSTTPRQSDSIDGRRSVRSLLTRSRNDQKLQPGTSRKTSVRWTHGLNRLNEHTRRSIASDATQPACRPARGKGTRWGARPRGRPTTVLPHCRRL